MPRACAHSDSLSEFCKKILGDAAWNLLEQMYLQVHEYI
jgi:hypothetical protein